MADHNGTEDRDLIAGDFSSWLIEISGAIRGERGSDVPCAGCTACCTSSQFIQIGPDETDTLSCIPAKLLFPSPGRPRGHVLLGYDERGHCPMLIDNRCSIYEHRPKTCRSYDCRIFPATGLEIDLDDKLPLARQARRWKFSFPGEADQNQHDAVRAAARFVRERRGLRPDDALPTNTTQLAVLALELHDVFLRHDEATGQTTLVDPEPDVVRAELLRRIAARGSGTDR
jgi:Fe-S-cluster containining protein